MRSPTIVPRHRVPSASSLLEAIGESLSVIKEQDGLTDADLGAVMHKGADQGGKYRAGIAEMGVIAFLRGAGAWNGRFANEALALIGMKLVPIDTADVSDQSIQTRLAQLMVEMSVALEDGQIDEIELQRMKRSLIAAGEGIDALRGRAA